MILPKDRDPRFITIRRGGTLTDSDHRLLALWAAAYAGHVLHLIRSGCPQRRQAAQAGRVTAQLRPSQRAAYACLVSGSTPTATHMACELQEMDRKLVEPTNLGNAIVAPPQRPALSSSTAA